LHPIYALQPRVPKTRALLRLRHAPESPVKAGLRGFLGGSMKRRPVLAWDERGTTRHVSGAVGPLWAQIRSHGEGRWTPPFCAAICRLAYTSIEVRRCEPASSRRLRALVHTRTPLAPPGPHHHHLVIGDHPSGRKGSRFTQKSNREKDAGPVPGWMDRQERERIPPTPVAMCSASLPRRRDSGA